jgi:hypothetical protein
MNNRYLIYLGKDKRVVSWNPPDPHPIDDDLTYMGRVFEAVERSSKVRGLTFYYTWQHVGFHELPSYGEDVVVILVGDEWCRVPPYFNKVRAVFKWYGVRPILGCDLRPSYLAMLTAAQYVRMLIRRVPGLAQYWSWKLSSVISGRPASAPIFPIPLGYDKGQLDLPIVPIDQREYDVFFAGSVNHEQFSRWSLRNIFGNPKALSRSEMIARLRLFAETHPDVKVRLSVTRSFHDSESAGVTSYSKDMMNAKICVVPRGTSFETFRFFEALRYGCIIVTEPLPPRWFYDRSPAIRMRNWRALDETLAALLRDKNAMRQKHEAALKWWNTTCSELAVGTYIADTVWKLGVISEQASFADARLIT